MEKKEKREAPEPYGQTAMPPDPSREGTEFPQGDGQIGCPFCRGRGVVVVPEAERPRFAVGEITTICKCVHLRDTLDNLNRAWKGLAKVSPVKASPLSKRVNQNLVLTAQIDDLKAHLVRVGLDHGWRWFFRVITDIDLMTTWLYSAQEVKDPDVAKARIKGDNQVARLTDLVEPAELLVIRLGQKAARNVATPEVLLEALNHREHLDKPTWLVDTESYPLDEGHISFDVRIGDHIDRWERLRIGDGTNIETTGVTEMGLPPARPNPVAQPHVRANPGRERASPPPDEGDEMQLFPTKDKGFKGGRKRK